MRIGARKPQFPVARSQGLLVEEVDSEKVIFDEETKQAHCLAPLASVVFDHCDGRTSPAELARIASDELTEPISEEHVEQALAQLDDRGLLATALPITISRREMVKKSAAYGAAAAAAATLISTVAPPMANAASCTSTACSTNAQCPGNTGCAGGPTHCTTCVNHLCTCT
jgi:Coenzyme PQQ synthesis protein D (PqqD)